MAALDNKGLLIYFKLLKFGGIFPYQVEGNRVGMELKHGRRVTHLMVVNIAVTALIFVKQSALLFLTVQKKRAKETVADEELIFRTMWFLGTLFLQSMFAMHIVFPSKMVQLINIWFVIHDMNEDLLKTHGPSTPSKLRRSRRFTAILWIYLSMWIGGQMFMAALYAWNPQFYPFLPSYLPSLSGWYWKTIGTGIIETHFMGLAMAAMASFDIILCFVTIALIDTINSIGKVSLRLRKFPIEMANLVQVYHSLRICGVVLEETYSQLICAHFAVVFMILPFSVFGLVHYALSVQTALFFMFCLIFLLGRIGTIWVPLAIMELKTEKLKEELFSSSIPTEKSPDLPEMRVRLFFGYRKSLSAMKPMGMTCGGLFWFNRKSVMKFVYFSTTYMVMFLQ